MVQVLERVAHWHGLIIAYEVEYLVVCGKNTFDKHCHFAVIIFGKSFRCHRHLGGKVWFASLDGVYMQRVSGLQQGACASVGKFDYLHDVGQCAGFV